MNAIRLAMILPCAASMICPAQANYTEAGQEVSAAIEAFCTSLQDINTLLRGVTDRNTADAVTNPLRAKTKEMYLNHRKVQELSVNKATNDEDYAALTRQVLQLQLLQAEFEQQCMRLSANGFYESVKLARLFQSIAALYQREQTGAQAAPAPAQQEEAPAIDENERRRREQKRNERLKLYGK